MQPGEEEAVFFILMLRSVNGMMPVEHGAEGQGGWGGNGVGEGQWTWHIFAAEPQV